jgi:hypothetical protein
MEGVYAVATTKSLDLVKEQMKLIEKKRVPPAEVIILCGGLRSSPYVETKFKDFCEDDCEGRVKIIQPLQPWSVVCRGAALRGLEDCPILSRRSRANYGFAAHEKFQADKHDEADAIDVFPFDKRAKDQMFWPFKKVRSRPTLLPG